MILQQKTLEQLREYINELMEFRSGPKLVSFFNDLGFKDIYEPGFPSRWIYTDSKLVEINGTPELDKCIRKTFAPIDYAGKLDVLDNHIEDFNKYLLFDDWQIKRRGKEILFEKSTFQEAKNVASVILDEQNFIESKFEFVDVEKIGLDANICEVLRKRIEEISLCFNSKAWLSAIILAGSTLEGMLLGVALKNPKIFNCTNSSPKKEGKVKQFHEWSLSNLIDVATEAGLLYEDVRKFSHSLRDFRNYIHPYEQMSSQFYPTEHTAKISLQVLNAAIYQLSEK